MNHIAIGHARTLLVLVLFITQFFIVTPVGVGKLEPIGAIEYRVAAEVVVVAAAEGGKRGGRRRLAQPFQLCLDCKCCAAPTDPTTCATMPCCFGIDCQLPNKPFGVCAFVPKTCNCTSCATA